MRLSRRTLLAGAVVTGAAFAASCGPRTRATQRASINIDWVPSAEYYGFFTAREQNIFTEQQLEASIENGSGAPVIASQIATGATRFGTTTSDNLTRIIARGASVRRAMPLLPFNPASLISREPLNNDLRTLRGKTVGVNVQSAVYAQFTKALATANVSAGSVREYPIGFGGVEEFISGRVDAFLGYTSNHSIDLDMRNVAYHETRFDDLGIASAGLVLVESGESRIPNDDLGERVFGACHRGYAFGADNPEAAVASLRQADPTLDQTKLQRAITKITTLARAYTPQAWDGWLAGEDMSADAIATTNRLMTASYSAW